MATWSLLVTAHPRRQPAARLHFGGRTHKGRSGAQRLSRRRLLRRLLDVPEATLGVLASGQNVRRELWARGTGGAIGGGLQQDVPLLPSRKPVGAGARLVVKRHVTVGVWSRRVTSCNRRGSHLGQPLVGRCGEVREPLQDVGPLQVAHDKLRVDAARVLDGAQRVDDREVLLRIELLHLVTCRYMLLHDGYSSE